MYPVFKIYENFIVPLGKIFITEDFCKRISVLVDTFTNFMNRETGHFIKNNPSTDEFVDKLYIDVPKKANPNGLYVIQPFFQDIIQLIINNQNPYALTEGNIINTNLQPVVIFEISRLEPNSKGLSQSHITII